MSVDQGFREKPPVQIVELSPEEWEKLRDIKLSSLDEEPVAFEDPAEGKAKWTARPEAEWRGILAGKMTQGRAGESVNVFAKAVEDVVGMVSAIIPETESEKTATVQHMYVNGDFRGYGIGRELLQGLIERLKAKDIRKANLDVISTQIPAIELYKSLGFVEKEMKENSARRGGKVYDELAMELDLSKHES